jgi:osmotically inducible protein OsmC
MPTSTATAVWEGGLKEGKGSFAAGTGTFHGAYSVPSRFGDGAAGQTSPEELIAAAHASCLAMALSAGLERAGTPPTRIATRAACTVEKVGDGFRITRMELQVRGTVPGLSAEQFARAAEDAKNGCPVSNALKDNVVFVLDAELT